MLDQVNKLIDMIKRLLIWVVAPIGLLVFYIMSLKNKIDDLQTELAKSKAEKELAGTIAKKVEAQDAANQSEADYNTLRNAYLDQSSPSRSKEEG